MTVGESLWERRWTEGHVEHLQVLRAIPLVEGGAPTVVVRVTIHVDTMYFERQSHATAEIFDGQQWHTVSGLPSVLMRSGSPTVAGSGRARWNNVGAERDIETLVNDVALAFAYRAPSPGEWPRITREATISGDSQDAE